MNPPDLQILENSTLIGFNMLREFMAWILWLKKIQYTQSKQNL